MKNIFKFFFLIFFLIIIFFLSLNKKIIINSYLLFNCRNCNLKTFFFQRKNDEIPRKHYKFNIIKNYNLTFYSEKNEDKFRVTKLKALGFSRNENLNNHFNLYILPYIMKDDLKKKISKSIINKYQKINQFFNYKEYSSKSLLYLNYRKMKKLFPILYNYMPETFSYPEDKFIILKKFKYYSYFNASKDNMWLVKPKLSLSGKGIHFLENISYIDSNYLITKYLYNPHLIKGLKYDLRVHGLVTSIKPLKIYLYNEGLVRLATEIYNSYNKDNKFCFLTNLYLNKKNKKKFIYPQNISNIEDSHLWNFKALQKYYLRNGIDFNKIFEDIKDIFIKMIFSVREKIIKNIEVYNLSVSNFYHLIGFDIILDENLKPYLLEVNRKTGFRDNNDAEKNFTFNIIIDTINLVGIFPMIISKKRKNNYNLKEIIEENICELNKPRGGYQLIFPLKKNIEMYKTLYLNNIPKEDLELWKYLKE